MASEEPSLTNTKTSSDVYADENIDEKISAQQLEIEKEIAREQPLVGKQTNLQIILSEYLESDDIYRKKIKNISYKKNLMTNYRFIRKTRGDGNCFFRAFAFSYFESLIGQSESIENLKQIVEKCSQDLVNQLGYNSFTIDDFKEVFIEELDKLKNGNLNDLENSFNDTGISDYLVVFLRLVVSSYLQMNSAFYESFLEGGYTTMKDFCSHEVEPMYRESDHIHIIALTQALNAPVGIIYLDRADQDQATPHNFPDDSQPNIHILYRPGHYDIIYK